MSTFHILSLILVCLVLAYPAYPFPTSAPVKLHLQPRADPQFPPSPPSCPICAANYSSINSCAQAAPVLANFSQIIFNPGAFVSVIECSCTDTFQAVFPQCVDCFQQTNQTDVLDTPNLPSVVDGMRKICALESTLLGGVATADGEVTPTTSTASVVATSTSHAYTSPAASLACILATTLLCAWSLVV